MSANSKIEWTESTWNPTVGCTKVSPGCDHCYAERITERFHGKGSFTDVKLHPDRLAAPLRWRKPRRVFVNSMSDLFHDGVPDEFIARAWVVMSLAPQHQFQLLTKRHSRLRSLLTSPRWTGLVQDALSWVVDNVDAAMPAEKVDPVVRWAEEPERIGDVLSPLANVWLGVSVEDQKWAGFRIPALLETPAAVRFLSCEPLLSAVDLIDIAPVLLPDSAGRRQRRLHGLNGLPVSEGQGIDWVIVGGESGPGARPMHPNWARSLRDQCEATGVPFFFKQWGEYAPMGVEMAHRNSDWKMVEEIRRVGKKTAGRELDGRTWDEYPVVEGGAS